MDVFGTPAPPQKENMLFDDKFCQLKHLCCHPVD